MLFFAELLLWSLVFFLGACLFSFLNVLVWRLPRHEGVVRGRSHCPKCGRQLTAWELIPCFSFLLLRGRCKGCGMPISPRYFWVETLGGLLSLLCHAHFGIGSAQAFLAFAVLFLLTVVALMDHDTMEIWDRFTLALGLCALCSLAIFPGPSLKSRLVGAVLVSLPMLLLALLIPGAFGGGDIKLMLPLGFLLGWKATLAAGFAAVLLGGLYGALLLLFKKAGRKDHFAFGPFLCLSSGAALFWGEALTDRYLALLGL